METVTITFTGDQVQITTAGFTGSACKLATKELKEALGLTDIEEVDTREAYARTQQAQEVRRGR